MANICDFTMRIAGTEPAVAELLNGIANELSWHWRIDESIQNGELTPYPGCKSSALGYADVEGSCAWSIRSSMIENKGERTLKTEAKRLGLVIEAFSREPGLQFQEHYLIGRDGNAVIADCIDFWQYSVDSTPEEEWEYIEKVTGHTREMLMRTECDGYISAGGYGSEYGEFTDLSRFFAEPAQTQMLEDN